MTTSMLLLTLILAVATLSCTPIANAFSQSSATLPKRTHERAFSIELCAFGKKKQEEDLSFIESRDMTREEMLALNKENEEIMNTELAAMTGFSLLLSLPILYLCWVAFFSD